MVWRHTLFLVGLILVVDVRASEAQCSYSVSPTSVSSPSFATNSSLSVITGSSCTYGATSSVPWITITSVTGQGLGQVNYSVAENTTGASRVGTITVAGLVVTVTQAASSCTFTVMPTTVSVVAIGTNSSISVTTGSSCSWTSSTATTWITITSGSGTGIKPVNYTVAANSGAARTGTMTVAGQTVTVNQAGSSTGGPPPPAPPTNVIIR